MSTPKNFPHPKKQRVFVRPTWLCLLLALVASSCFTPGHDARTKLSIVHSLPMANGACGVWSNGEAYCWGNTNHFYDDPATTQVMGVDVFSPTRMAGDVKRVLPIEDYALCVITKKGRVLCRGLDRVTVGNQVTATGLLGRGSSYTSTTASYAFVQVVGLGGRGVLSNVVTGTAGRRVACVVLEDTRVACWGANRGGQLGVTGMAASSIPRIVQWDASASSGGGDLRGVTRLTGLSSGFCADLRDGRGACWGDEGDGRLGNGRNVTSQTGTLARYILGVGEMAGGGLLWKTSSASGAQIFVPPALL